MIYMARIRAKKNLRSGRSPPLPRQPRPDSTAARIEQPVLYDPQHGRRLLPVGHYRVQSLATEDHLGDLIRAQLGSQVINSETGTAISSARTEFLKQGLPS